MMKISTLLTAAFLGSMIVTVSHEARAADDDEAACTGKAEGDACTEADGDEGTCEPDSDTGVLECEDVAGSGCSTSGASTPGGAGAGLLFATTVLGGLVLHGARRARRRTT